MQTICQSEEQAYGKGMHRQPEELMRYYRKNPSTSAISSRQQTPLLAFGTSAA
jgi:hypothetical protein